MNESGETPSPDSNAGARSTVETTEASGTLAGEGTIAPPGRPASNPNIASAENEVNPTNVRVPADKSPLQSRAFQANGEPDLQEATDQPYLHAGQYKIPIFTGDSQARIDHRYSPPTLKAEQTLAEEQVGEQKRSKACFDWNENTPDVGDLDGLTRIIKESMRKNQRKATSQPLEAEAQPTPSRHQGPPHVPHLERPSPPTKPVR